MSESLSEKQSEHTTFIETRGVDYIPESERHSNPLNVFFVFVGAQFCYAIMILGTLPIIFGLGWWSAFWSITLGLLLGCTIIAPIAVLGTKTGTNGIISSRAHFGIRGGIIGGILTLFVCFGFGALNIWTGAQALIYGGQELLGWAVSDGKLSFASILLMLAITVIVFFGYQLLILIEKIGTWFIGALLILTVFVFMPQFDASYAGAEYILSGFWPTWLLSFFVAAALPVSYCTLVNDYTRYIPRSTKKHKTMLGLSLGMFVGCWISMNIAAFLMSIFLDADVPFVEGLFTLAPAFFIIPLLLIGLLGSIPQGAVAYYGASLGFDAFGWGQNRVTATVISSVVMLILVLFGIFVYDMTALVDGFVSIIIVALSPWLIINVIGDYLSKSTYLPEQLHVKNETGTYWYNHGFQLPALVAWLIGSITGLLFKSSILFEGPFVSLMNGVDISFFVAIIVGGVLYYILCSFSRSQTAGNVVETEEMYKEKSHVE